ncbi:MAG TPA: preprotein translocase subunit SecG [Candidatus Moranbacteria bacterium]|nr:preprotein translocase subunit SecG [Candidatus Moranbacteria bacterium]
MKFIVILQIIVSTLLVVSILMQNRGSGLSASFGGGMGGYHTKRGFEKFLNNFSIVLSVLFIILAIISVFKY